MPLYRQRVSTVLAIQVTMDNLFELKHKLEFKTWSQPPMRAITGIEFKQGSTTTIVPFGCWIVFPHNGKPYVMTDEDFYLTFQPLSEITK